MKTEEANSHHEELRVPTPLSIESVGIMVLAEVSLPQDSEPPKQFRTS